VGMVVEILQMTGLGIKFPGMVETWSQGNLTIALILVAISSIILGMGMPPSAAYIIVAIAAAPAIVNLGVPILAAHMFVFYYSVMGMVTPPVAGGAIVASRMAGLLMLTSAQIGLVNYYFTSLRLVERLLFLLCALFCLLYIIAIPMYVMLIMGVSLFALLTITQLRRRRSPQPKAMTV